MKIYTKTGDSGTTGLFGGDRVSKSHPRLDAYGTVDETNSVLGFACSTLNSAPMEDLNREWAQTLINGVQKDLFVVGAELATPVGARPSVPRLSDADIQSLETAIDDMESELPPLKAFILPGGTPAASALHIARTVCRRSERMVVALGEKVEIDKLIPIYLNRLSDLLFVLARWVNFKCGERDVEWHPN